MATAPADSIAVVESPAQGPPGACRRTSTACHMCRDKKVRCSGTQPCVYCLKRGLNCVFAKTAKRRLFSVSHVQDLEQKVARYENRGASSAASSPSLDVQTQPTPAAQGLMGIAPVPLTSQTSESPSALAPGTSLSSSDTFSSELRTLLRTRSRPEVTSTPARVAAAANTPGTATSAPLHRGLGAENIRHWPTEEDAQSMLIIVFLQVGISQHLFDVRSFSDNLAILYDVDHAESGPPALWMAECLLVFAIGRLLQARWDDASTLPGHEFFSEAIKQIPGFCGLKEQGILGIELMALSALYLQVADRKDEAYLYASMALRLAMGLGLHRAQPDRGVQRSQMVHCNRLWWSVYMQERRLAAAVGLPMAISDSAITARYPSNQVGHSSAAAIGVNVQLAEITGRITATIYSQSKSSEPAFIEEVQDILQSLHKIENTMPFEIAGGLHPSELLLMPAPLPSSQSSSARTIASLYLTVYQTIIYAVRPILLYMARSSFSEQGEGLYDSMSPTLRRLADTCVEAARKSLVILQGLRKQEIIAKHAFMDLDCLFSAGFIFVLASAISPRKNQTNEGIESARSILQYLTGLGNRAAARRLFEIDQMCAHLTLPTGDTLENPSSVPPQRLLQPFTFDTVGVSSGVQDGQYLQGSQEPDASGGGHLGGQDAAMSGVGDLANIELVGEENLYWMYHNPALSLTGVELADWEALENQISNY